MRFVIYGINYRPELTGVGKFSGEMAEWLVAKGHEVHVVTAPPYYPQWRVSDDHRSKLLQLSAFYLLLDPRICSF